jgi:membrane protease YdiL (CAAX protease family)
VIAVRPAFAPGFPIRKPVKREIIAILICTALGFAFLAIRFFTDWNQLPGLVKLSALALIVFTFPIALAAIYLFRYRYKPREMGVNINYWYLPILLHIIWGGLTLWLAPEKSHWRQAWVEYGLWGSLFTGLISAALPEEFARLLLQTRIGRACNSIAFGLFIASAIWATMHIPVGYNQTHQPVTFFSASESIAYLIPLGMFWGYLTQRTRSLLPAVLMHGFNLWGLQNF